MNPEYKFQVGAMRYVPKYLINYLKMVGFNAN